MLKLIEVQGWRLALEGSDVLTIRDIDLGERLGYLRPRKIRELIERLEKEGKLPGVQRRPVLGRRGFVEESVEEVWLNERQTLKVVAKSETDAADAILDEVIDVFMLARRGLLAEAQQAAGSPSSMTHEEVALLASKVGAETALARAAVLALPPAPVKPDIESLLLKAAGDPKLAWTHRNQLALAAGGWWARPVLARLIASGQIVERRHPRRIVTADLAEQLDRRASGAALQCEPGELTCVAAGEG